MSFSLSLSLSLVLLAYSFHIFFLLFLPLYGEWYMSLMVTTFYSLFLFLTGAPRGGVVSELSYQIISMSSILIVSSLFLALYQAKLS